MNAPIKTLCSSGGPKHKIHSEHGIVFLNRSVKNLNLAAFRTEKICIPRKAARLRFLTDQVFKKEGKTVSEGLSKGFLHG
jgi:hypothetical protein